jgi:hypothetical protein
LKVLYFTVTRRHPQALPGQRRHVVPRCRLVNLGEFRRYPQAVHNSPGLCFARFIARRCQRLLEVRKAPAIVARAVTVVFIACVQFAGFLGKGAVDLATFRKEIFKPVIVCPVLFDCPLDAFRQFDIVVIGDKPPCAFNNPRQDSPAARY